MKNTEQIQVLSIKELVLCVQNQCVQNNDRIVFRTSDYFHELVRKCIKERGLSSEKEFFERLAKDYFSRLGWMPREHKTPTYLSDEELEMTPEQSSMAIRKINWYRSNHQ